MADLTFALYDLNDCEIELGQLKSYELCRDADAPCDSLRITFINDTTIPEAYRAKAFLMENVCSTALLTPSEKPCTKAILCAFCIAVQVPAF